jgi:hypothetical protein
VNELSQRSIRERGVFLSAYDLFTVMFAGKEVVFDCATLFHGTNWSDD